MNIRHATMADLKAITEVEAQCFPPAEAADEAAIARRLAVFPDRYWLLEEGDTLVGFVNGMATDLPDLCDEMYENAAMHEPEGAWQMIFGLDTIPARRRQGCAAQLLNRCIEDSRARSCKGLVLTCKDHLVHYYAKFGFVSEGVSGSTHGGVQWFQMRLTF